MKIVFALLAVSIAVVRADPCDTTKFVPLLSNPAVATCTEQSKYSFVPPTRPTDEQLVGICKSEACKQVLGAVAAMGLPDCTIGTLSVKTDLLERVTKGCAALAAAGGGGGGATPAPSTSAPGATTTAPSASASATTTPAPSSTTAQPTATTTPVPSATKNATTTTAPASATSTAASGKDDESEEYADAGSASGSSDYSIEDAGQVEETSAPESSAPKTAVPKPAPTSGAVARTVMATGAAATASIVVVFVL